MVVSGSARFRRPRQARRVVHITAVNFSFCWECGCDGSHRTTCCVVGAKKWRRDGVIVRTWGAACCAPTAEDVRGGDGGNRVKTQWPDEASPAPTTAPGTDRITGLRFFPGGWI